MTHAEELDLPIMDGHPTDTPPPLPHTRLNLRGVRHGVDKWQSLLAVRKSPFN